MVFNEVRFRKHFPASKRARKGLRTRIETLCEISRKHVNHYLLEEPTPYVEQPVPPAHFSLARQVVFPMQITINVPLVLSFKRWLREEQGMLNLLIDTTDNPSFTPLCLIARASAEEQVKSST